MPQRGLETPNGNGVRWGSVDPRLASTEPNGFAFSWRLGPTGRPLKNGWASLGNLVKADDVSFLGHAQYGKEGSPRMPCDVCI